MNKKAIRIEPEDNVAVVAQDTAPGDTLKIGEMQITAKDAIPVGHKIALTLIPGGKEIIKYAVTIGLASGDIEKGAFVHSHNVEDITNQLCDEYEREFRARGRLA